MVITGDAKTIAAAFVKACKDMNPIVIKDRKGVYGDYATLASLVEATHEAFANHGLAIVQEASADEQGICVETWLIHESGATMQFSPLTMPLGDRKPQTIGSALTYARRYALGAICGLAPDDDDAEAAQASEKAQAPTPTPALATPEQVALLKKLGLEFYGKTEWEEQLPKIVEAVSTGAALKAEDLKPREAEKLIEGIKKRMAQVAQMKEAA